MRPLLPLVPLVLAAALLAPVPTATATPALASAPAAAAAVAPAARTSFPDRQIDYTQWDTGQQLRSGRLAGTRVTRGQVVLAPSSQGKTRRYQGRTYDVGRWVSPWAAPGFGLTQLIASWKVQTPGDSWVEVRVRGRDAAGKRSSWDVLARYAVTDKHVRRTTADSQADDLARVNVDTWQALADAGLTSWRLQVSLMRRTGTTGRSPALDTIGAMSSRLPSGPVATSKPGPARGVVLDVPRYSQMVHSGHSPQWGGGGQAWCSPTSTSMVLGYYDALPSPASYSWVPQRHVDPFVDHAARMTYDSAYGGTGNWPFNTAYAAPLAGHAFVTRLPSLRQAERFVKAGIPLVASVSFGRGGLTGAPISATNGHLLVIVGFTADGDVVVNDPAASGRSGVRRTYDRGQFENAWLPTSGGLVYVIHDDAHPLPKGSSGAW